MNRYLRLLCIIGLFPNLASATGMAVSLKNLYLQNNSSKSTLITIKNLAENNNQFRLQPRSICRIDQPLMFQPFTEESNNFVIMIENKGKRDPIVIDKLGLITLAHNSKLKIPHIGQVKNYSLLGFCGNQLYQRNFLEVEPHTNTPEAPNFNLVKCAATSNFIYLISDISIKDKKYQKPINFGKIKDCALLKARK